jgi:hypothetical protein
MATSDTNGPPKTTHQGFRGVCVVRDPQGVRALADVSRAVCQAGFVTDKPPIPAFQCLPPDDEETTSRAYRRGRAPQMNCRIEPGTWIPDAVKVVADADGNMLCYAVVNQAALGEDLEFRLPDSRICEPQELQDA